MLDLWFKLSDTIPTLYGRYLYGKKTGKIEIQATFENWEMAFRVFPNIRREK